jgi:glycosyltransferase involved in cell wall biosynthesis
MRILLVGEYSGFHNSLKHGLQQLGHQVTIIGDGDGFKKFPVDIEVGSNYFEQSWLHHKIKVGWYRLSGYNLEDRLKLARFRESENLFKNHDIIQFINSNAFDCEPAVERIMMDYLLKNNGTSFLVACGDDCEYANYIVKEHKGYSILDAVKRGIAQKKDLIHTYKYLGTDYQDNYNHLLNASKNIIPSNTDFAMPLENQSKATPIIPAPIDISRFLLEINEELDQIHIFIGINRGSYFKKGIYYFEQALEIIKKKYGEKVQITVAQSLPYKEYITKYKKAHILLDQVLCYDQGYNALEAMAQGKVVFAGGSELYLKAHGLDAIPVIDAQPDVTYLVQQLTMLIENPNLIIEIGKAARSHVVNYHDSIKVAKAYEQLYLNSGK